MTPGVAHDARKRGARCFAPVAVFALLVVLAAACGSLPKINGAPLPPEPADANPVYRDLASIPGAPAITSVEKNQDAIKALGEDRAKAAEAGQKLRREPFNEPDPAMHVGF